jgi:hypothetical protein
MDTITGKDVQFSFIGLTNKAKSYIGFDWNPLSNDTVKISTHESINLTRFQLQ